MKYRWQIHEKLADNQVAKPLRKLLHDQWLLPNRLIHYLRIRRTVLVNGNYRSMNEIVEKMIIFNYYFVVMKFVPPPQMIIFRLRSHIWKSSMRIVIC